MKHVIYIALIILTFFFTRYFLSGSQHCNFSHAVWHIKKGDESNLRLSQDTTVSTGLVEIYLYETLNSDTAKTKALAFNKNLEKEYTSFNNTFIIDTLGSIGGLNIILITKDICPHEH
ncbi:MAG: hypothetical protein KA270_01725 [Saprospiraceae bacterium]|nr:hypothetical protein [Saprospiraceae bacterium]MBP6565852.1 hypothetical protein [Saprospiraceae bacterium]